MRKKIIKFLYTIPLFRSFLYLFHLTIGKNKIVISSKNRFDSTTSNIYKNCIKILHGNNNSIFIDENSDLHNSNIRIKGNNNSIQIGRNSFINGLKIIIEGDNNKIIIGNNVFVLDDTRLYVVDGSQIIIKDRCMFSDHIELRTTDNHAIRDIHTGKRLNYEKNIILETDVWVGMHTILLKGCEISEGCIIGAGSVVTHSHCIPHSIIAGNPAKMIKENISWTMER